MRLEKGRTIVWVVYFDAERSRSEGREVPKSLAVKKPTLEEVVKAARELGLNPEPVPGKKHPRAWWDGPQGYVIVDKVAPRYRLLKEIAKKIKELRGNV